MRWPMLLVVCFASVSCGLPRDPEQTLDRVRNNVLRVGVIHDAPWVRVERDRVSGVEVELVETLANELGATVHWVRGGESRLLEALEQHGLDLVIGGLSHPSPWSSRIGLSRDYFQSRLVVGSRAASSVPEDIEDVEVLVEQGNVLTAALLSGEGAVPREVTDLTDAEGLVAGRDWQLLQLGFQLSDIELQKRNHVIAVPPGENRWLLHVDRFLYRQRARIPSLLEREAAS